jgi:hypothetical protein
VPDHGSIVGNPIGEILLLITPNGCHDGRRNAAGEFSLGEERQATSGGAGMTHEMLDAEENRLYGALLTLVRDQLASVKKTANSRFAFLGKNKIQSRNKDIETCLFRIIESKYETHGEAAFSAILTDLNAIEDDRTLWPDVSADQIDCVRRILRNV